jgi:D-threonate/D-erythronate kinase
MRLGLVADDVTGAGDASVQFAKRGWDTFLTLQLGSDPRVGNGIRAPLPASDRSVMAISTDSRALPNDKAEKLTFDAVMRLIEMGIHRVFLKIDSTMRGSVRGQIAGGLAAWRGRHADAQAIVCPAYPRMGRTVQANRLFVNGEPVETTAIGRDPVTPVTTSHMSVLIPPSPAITLADAATDDGLNALAASIAAAGPSVIAVGSGGLAEALADVWTADSAQLKLRPTSDRPTSHRLASDRPATDAIQLRRSDSKNPRILLLVTSLNPVSHVQVARLIEAFPDIEVVLAPTERVGGPSVAEALASEFTTLVECRTWDLVGLIGGDGARAALTRLDASGVRIVGSVVEGIPIGVIIGGRADGMPVFTKAGGFGADDALVKVIERILV